MRQYWLVSVTAHLHLHTTFHRPNNFHKPWFLSFSPQCFLCPEWQAPGDGDHSTDCASRNIPEGGVQRRDCFLLTWLGTGNMKEKAWE